MEANTSRGRPKRPGAGWRFSRIGGPCERFTANRAAKTELYLRRTANAHVMSQLYEKSDEAVTDRQKRDSSRSRRQDMLLCKRCGERFVADEATNDGWHYECPNDDCDGAGIGEDLAQLKDTLLSAH